MAQFDTLADLNLTVTDLKVYSTLLTGVAFGFATSLLLKGLVRNMLSIPPPEPKPASENGYIWSTIEAINPVPGKQEQKKLLEELGY